MARIQNETRQCGCTVVQQTIGQGSRDWNYHEEAQKRADALIARNNALASLSQLLTADWAVTPEEKQLARKIIDRLTHNAAKKGFKGQ